MNKRQVLLPEKQATYITEISNQHNRHITFQPYYCRNWQSSITTGEDTPNPASQLEKQYFSHPDPLPRSFFRFLMHFQALFAGIRIQETSNFKNWLKPKEKQKLNATTCSRIIIVPGEAKQSIIHLIQIKFLWQGKKCWKASKSTIRHKLCGSTGSQQQLWSS